MRIMRTMYGGMALLTLFAVRLSGQDVSSGVRFNGFGGWAYGRTDGNTADLGDHHGSWEL